MIAPHFPKRVLAFSPLRIYDPYEGDSHDDPMALFELLCRTNINSIRALADYIYPSKIYGIKHPPYCNLWTPDFKINQHGMNIIKARAVQQNRCNLIPIITIINCCEFFQPKFWPYSRLIKLVGTYRKDGLLKFYDKHFQFTVYTIQTVIDMLTEAGVTAIIEPMNESRLDDGLEWLEKIRTAINLPPNIKLMCSHTGDYDPPVQHLYDYVSYHGICKLDVLRKRFIGIRDGTTLSTDGCMHTGGSYFQGRPGAKEIKPILQRCSDNGVGFEHMAKEMDCKTGTSPEYMSNREREIIILMTMYGDPKGGGGGEGKPDHKPQEK